MSSIVIDKSIVLAYGFSLSFSFSPLNVMFAVANWSSYIAA